jgi:hypothetical protein
MGYCSVTKEGLSIALDVRKTGPTNVVHLVVGGIVEMFCTPWHAPAEQIVLYRTNVRGSSSSPCNAGVILFRYAILDSSKRKAKSLGMIK